MHYIWTSIGSSQVLTHRTARSSEALKHKLDGPVSVNPDDKPAG